MTTRSDIINLLRGKTARRIRFTFSASGGDLTVNAASFRQVAEAIENGHITIDVATTFAGGAGATYAGATNTIATPPVHGRWAEASIMHEATHAWFDLTRASLSALDDEAAAYVVSCLYCRMTGLTPVRWGQITRTARGVVTGILQHYARGTPGVPVVGFVPWQALRLFISTHDLYVAGPAGLGAQIIPFVNNTYTKDG